MTLPMTNNSGYPLAVHRRVVTDILNISEEQFEYMLKMFSINQTELFFTKTKLDMFIDYQIKTGNVKIKRYDETIFFSSPDDIKSFDTPNICLSKIVSAPHQLEAKEKVIEASKTLSRMQIVSACGTGKTHIAQIVTEEILPLSEHTITMILLPSLALVGQFYASWVKFTNIDDHRHPFVVCSDQDVINVEGADIAKHEYDFKVNTAPEYIVSFTIKFDNKILHAQLSLYRLFYTIYG